MSCFSQKLDRIWQDLGKAMGGENTTKIGQMDCRTSRTVCRNIRSFPTFKLFYNGEEVAKYDGKGKLYLSFVWKIA